MTVLLTCEDWTEFVLADPYQIPTFPTRDAYLALTAEERRRVAELRTAHNAREVIVAAGPIELIIKRVRRRHILNQRTGPKAKSGFAIDGLPRTGKTTILQTVGLVHERSLRTRTPDRFIDRGGARQTPVVYFSLPQNATEKTISKGLAECLNVPYLRRDNEQDITRRVLRALDEMATELLLIDEVHNLGGHGWNTPGRVSRQTANDYLKNFCNHCSATPILAGVCLEQTGLFREFYEAPGDRGNQTSGRFTALPTGPYGLNSNDEIQVWRQLIHAMEGALHLYDHPSGTLAKLGPYLHQRTSGYIGTLSQLVREAAVIAIEDGYERIDRTVLDEILVDKLSEDAYAKNLRQATARTRQQSRPARDPKPTKVSSSNQRAGGQPRQDAGLKA